ncbi:formate dehydrogenase accessory sulfurtransferase FdhD [Acetobacterium woodii]|uniref:Sulfur carrier protein FdhD n=1 Tax=Acetobacterium woodii (strain ATCC 29683 / DSM 1030 / JCM 2381 / KCTC 1655 / WB1) TaxID=931626 RepID=H6LB63_ACEWD|nr:formate dehydrogenase accessory sulfurtransferase FdhD [Acetobacterium woodii]AFA47615.1 formate dehydrogenase accessory protein FdhD [Acetobacterium woodii DSM 1030]
MDTFLKLPVVKVNGDQTQIIDETIITEYPLTLYVNDKVFNTFYCTPQDLEALVVGYLMSCGRLGAKQDILGLEIIRKKNIAKIQLAKCATKPELKPVEKPMLVKIENIYEIMIKNIKPTELFLKTGGFHNVAIYDNKKEIITMMDVARHNAVDKVLGYCVLNEIDCRDKMLVVSGRISVDMLIKAEQGNIPMVLSKSAPTSLSVARADAAGITLVGFIRGEQMNVYTHPTRIDLGEEAFRAINKNKRITSMKNASIYLRS